MILYISIALLTVLAARWGLTKREYREERGTRAAAMSRIAYALIFLTLFIPAALRSNTGNDYLKYVDFMHLIRSNAYVPTETGFNTFVRAVYAASGYENYLLVFALLSAMTIALFLAAVRDQSVDFFLSFFLFMTLGYYFQSYSTVRYYFALAIVIYSLKFFLNREYVPFLLLVLLAAGFHKSVLVVLILYPLALIPWNAVIYLCGAALCAAFAAFPDFWLKVVVKLYPSYEDTEYLSGSGFNPAAIARCAAVLILAIIAAGVNGERFSRKIHREKISASDPAERFYLHSTVLALAIYAFCSFLPIISRIGYYLTMPQIFYIPLLLRKLPDRKRKVFTGLVMLAGTAYFILLLRRMSSDGLRLLPYHSFLFYDLPKILSEMRD